MLDSDVFLLREREREASNNGRREEEKLNK